MIVYGDLAIALNFTVDLCLLLGANRLAGYGANWKRVLPAAALGSLYGVACLVPGFAFLGSWLWRLTVLTLMSVIAFGTHITALRRGVLFVFLSMALGGIATGIGRGGFWGIVASAGVVCILCFLGFHMPSGKSRFVPVVLEYGGKKRSVTALLDTGNLLQDPITGQPILLLGADVGITFAGLTDEAIRDPVGAVGGGKIKGARLIPYRSVGKGNGMLLGLQLDAVWIDGQKSGRLVAFAPEILSSQNLYQALTGGVI